MLLSITLFRRTHLSRLVSLRYHTPIDRCVWGQFRYQVKTAQPVVPCVVFSILCLFPAVHPSCPVVHQQESQGFRKQGGRMDILLLHVLLLVSRELHAFHQWKRLRAGMLKRFCCVFNVRIFSLCTRCGFRAWLYRGRPPIIPMRFFKKYILADLFGVLLLLQQLYKMRWCSTFMCVVSPTNALFLSPQFSPVNHERKTTHSKQPFASAISNVLLTTLTYHMFL